MKLTYIWLSLVALFALSGCAAVSEFMGTSVALIDTETGAQTETTVGDMVADSATAASSIFSSAVSGVNPILGGVGAAALAALLGSARRKKAPTQATA